jgi:hypothetical protein
MTSWGQVCACANPGKVVYKTLKGKWYNAADPSGEGHQLGKVLDYMRAQAQAGDAVQGFFLTTTLMMSGMAYFAGQLLKAASEGKFEGTTPFDLSQVTITLTGNGSRVYNMLSHPSYPFSTIMEELFRVGLEHDSVPIVFEGLYKHHDKVAPKVTVALGLLKDGINRDMTDVPVANLVCETGYPAPEGETRFNTPLVDFYQGIDKSDVSLSVPRTAPENLSRFIETLGEVIPYGMHGKFEIIPEATIDRDKVLQDELYEQAIPLLYNRIYASAEAARGIERIQKKKRPALEPLFVAQLAALIEAIRRLYAR